MAAFGESIIELAALAWFEASGWPIENGASIAPGEPDAERDDYGQVVLSQRRRVSLLQLSFSDLRFKYPEKFAESAA